MSAAPLQRSADDKTLTWDEETIAEHDKLRGTRQKIDEPDTPFNYDFDEQELRPAATAASAERGLPTAAADASLQLAALSQKLEDEAAKQEKGLDLNWAAHDPDCDDSVKATKRAKFADKRKHHYNEFERMQQWRAEQAARAASGLASDDEEEEEEEQESAQSRAQRAAAASAHRKAMLARLNGGGAPAAEGPTLTF